MRRGLVLLATAVLSFCDEQFLEISNGLDILQVGSAGWKKCAIQYHIPHKLYIL
jgi:hypothetical protein